MLTLRTEIGPRQIRALLVLLVLVPLIPTALMLRFMVDAVRNEQLAAREHLTELYRQSLTITADSLETHLRSHTFTRAAAPRAIVAFCRQLLSSDVEVRLIDERGRDLAGEAAPQGELIDEASVGESFPGWRILLYLKKPAISNATEDQVRTYQLAALGAIIVNLLIAGLAAVALHQRLRLNEIESSALATVAHELKTPVASMRLLIETLSRQRDEPSRKQTREYLALMAQENERLGHLLEHFLTLSRLDQSGNALQKEAVEPAELARASAERLDVRLHAGDCRFELDAPKNLPLVLADRERFTVALGNLLDNALKYTGAEKQIALRVRGSNGSVKFEVEDNGIGIAPDEKGKIFERFYQADQKLTRTREGCGLGLSIVKEIIAAHGGKISVRSEVARGSTFCVSLPAVKTSA
jgi:signal transduction histidine kinase